MLVRDRNRMDEVNSTRTGIRLDSSQEKVGLSSLVVDNDNQLSAVTFGTGFGAISDIKTGPTDGFMFYQSTMEVSTKLYHLPDDSYPIS
jgi:hypothetical protein